MKTLRYLILGLSLFSMAFAATEERGACKKTDPCKVVDPCKFYNIKPACVRLDGYKSFSVTGDLLYWYHKQNGFDFALSSTDPATSPVQNGKLFAPDYQYKLGFRVGIGAQIEKNNWKVDWIRFDHSNSNTVAQPLGGNLVPLIPLTPYEYFTSTKATGKNSLTFNMLDLTTYRPQWLGTNWLFRPFYGMKALCVKEKLEAVYENARILFTPINALSQVLPPASPYGNLNLDLSYDMWGVGPMTGIGFDWYLTENLAINTRGAFSIFYASSELDIQVKQPNLAPIIFSSNDKLFHINKQKEQGVHTSIEGDIGVSWGEVFNDTYHFDLALAYELQYFPEHYQYDILAESMLFHGLTAKARFDF